MARGVVSLYGVKSELFVAMNSRGRLYGTVGVRNCFLSFCLLPVQRGFCIPEDIVSVCVLNR